LRQNRLKACKILPLSDTLLNTGKIGVTTAIPRQHKPSVITSKPASHDHFKTGQASRFRTTCL
jgi:hypothetical protein